jgi:hypothetical protein
VTFLAPLWLWAAAAASAAALALHFFARQRPRPAPFPTARFVPDVAARAPSLARKPTDLLLLLLRVLALLAVGVGLARPQITPERRPLARVVLLGDSSASARDSARVYVGVADTLVQLESWRVRELESLSALLVRGIRASADLRDRADSIELVIVSSFAVGAFDGATDSIRALWPGRARLVHVVGRAPEAPRRIEVIGSGDDPLRAAVALLGARSGAVTRIVRGTPGTADSVFAAAGGVLVEWPTDVGPVADTIGAVTAGVIVVVAPFGRSQRVEESQSQRVIARWVDGSGAAAERAVGRGCIKYVAIPIPSIGDLALRRSLRELVDVLASPCGGSRAATTASDVELGRLRGSGPLMAARLAPEPARATSAFAAWLLAAAAALLLIEMAARPKALGA